jgi:prephenate dehydrogenase (NADP+)
MKIVLVGGAGRMGRVYAKALMGKGHDVIVSDINKLALGYYDGTSVKVYTDNKEAVRRGELVIYTGPIAMNPSIIKESARYVHEDAVVGGFTSAKTDEVKALKETCPEDVEIITFHPLHGESIEPAGQRMVIIPIREKATNSKRQEVENVFKELGMKITYIDTPDRHDKIMADAQGITHFFAVTCGLAWKYIGKDPKDSPIYQNEVDRFKRILTLSVLAQNPELYAGIAIHNPYVRDQTNAYVSSLERINDMIIDGEKKRLIQLWEDARSHLNRDDLKNADFLLNSLFKQPYNVKDQINSQISVFATAVTMMNLKIKPRDNVAFQTPPYMLRSLLTHKIMKDDPEQYIGNAINNRETRKDDLKFYRAVITYNQVINSGDERSFISLFEESKRFFGEEELHKALFERNELVKKLMSIQIV